jgi:hypothetical protein
MTAQKAQKMLMAFPNKIMYMNGPPGYLDEFVQRFKSCGYTVLSVASMRKLYKTTTSLIANLQKKIKTSENQNPIILYGSLSMETLDLIFGNDPFAFSYIYIYPNSANFAEKFSKFVKIPGSDLAISAYLEGTPSPKNPQNRQKLILKTHSKIYKEHLEKYERMLVIVD